MSFLKDKSGQKSSMRIAFVTCIVLSVILSMGMLYVMITAEVIDWLGMSAFLGAVTFLIGIAMTGKVKQKQVEDSEQ
jgi:hypothetical protein